MLSVIDELKGNVGELSRAYQLIGPLCFRELKGGICNAPVYVYQQQGGQEFPIGVFKREAGDYDLTNRRFALIDEMAAGGFKFHPLVHKNKQGEYLTKIGENYYSSIQYLTPDGSHFENTVSFEDMLQLTERFHAASQKLGSRVNLSFSRYELHLSRQGVIDEIPKLGIDSPLFHSEEWQRFLQLYRYFASSTAKALFNSLPHCIIHGDNHPLNLVYHKGEAYNVDLDPRRYDLRLYDFTSMICHGGTSIQDAYFDLAKNDNLFAVIDKHYGIKAMPLTREEKLNFHLVLSFCYIEFTSWALGRIKKNIEVGHVEPNQHLLSAIGDRIKKISQFFDAKLLSEQGISIGRASIRRASSSAFFPELSGDQTSSFIADDEMGGSILSIATGENEPYQLALS